MNLFIFCFLLCFPLIYCFDSAFLAVFLTGDAKNLLKSKFFRSHESSSPFYGNTRDIYCEHSTIQFNPRSDIMNKYKAHYGHVQKLTILAYAEDEHAQAILVHSAGSNDSHSSTNQYPHVTISVSNVEPFTPVYSNDLWKRFVDDRIVEIKMDEYDKPRSIAINDHMSEWHGKLNSNEKYAETQAYVKIINEVIDLNGIICVNNLWKNEKCGKN
ncbi:unnamed protein product [Rotaria magnacalcarata]|uniref:Uncharacterized protein n=2 Tax=Rotaria magnacalcarata TaxID=392030 RepID=A0A816V474_9BILA|nr:unnamed protein product [Rotaria magnacalcarata]CAF2118050.1 unnamed protein product [Rotaria magnacalcarata]CAF4196473.1 unnamed protein product [Rotaria magnacalcarata]CAF5188728.1 unnamed protein product [Rotaria magnacalcarata]